MDEIGESLICLLNSLVVSAKTVGNPTTLPYKALPKNYYNYPINVQKYTKSSCYVDQQSYDELKL